MKPFIENSLKEFVKKRDDIFGSESKFVGFKCDEIDADATEGFQSDNIFGRIRYINKNGDHLLSSPLLLKSTPAKSCVDEAVMFQFANEIFFYGHMLPFLTQLQTSISQFFPKFYTSFTQTCPQFTESVIFLEDLSHAQYKNAPRMSFLDYSHLSLMARSLGKFHACSYLAKQLDLLSFQARAFPLHPIHFNLIGQCPGFLTKLGSRGLERLAQQNEYKSYVPVIQHLLDNADQILMNIFKNERHNPWAVVCHGDYLSTNVMFKYEKDHPTEMKMIDFAMSTYSSPVLDLALFLYMNASQETRDLHWESLIEDYCHGLSSLPIRIATLPSRDDIIKELNSKAFYAYLMTSLFLPILISDDFKVGTLQQCFPSEYAEYDNILYLPLEVQSDVLLIVGGEAGTMALVDILKDMIKRGFIRV